MKNRWRPSYNIKAFHDAFGNASYIPVIQKPEDKTIDKLSDMPTKTIAFVDTETTGLDCLKDQIIQFSGIKYVYCESIPVMLKISEMNTYIKNKCPIPYEVTKVNGLTEEFLSSAPTEDEAFKQIKDWMSDVDVLAAYNTPFDAGFISALYDRYNEIVPWSVEFDVMAMFIDLYDIYKCQNRKLGLAAKFLGVSSGSEKLHDALEDITLTVKVFAAMVDQYSELPVNEAGNVRVNNILSSWTWENPQRYAMKRIYFSTDIGQVYFEKIDRSFGVNEAKCNYKLSDIDMDDFAKKACKYYKVNSIEELSHVRA